MCHLRFWRSAAAAAGEKSNRKLKKDGEIVALDISSVMCERARKQIPKYGIDIELLNEDALNNSIEDESVDCVISTFGLKTFSEEQTRVLMKQLYRILKPGGLFSFVEISVPKNLVIKLPYMFYLTCCIPSIGRLCLGNPDNYRYLSLYTKKFENCLKVQKVGQEMGLKTNYKDLFYGCASAIYGCK